VTPVAAVAAKVLAAPPLTAAEESESDVAVLSAVVMLV